jgi:hypothetical protein
MWQDEPAVLLGPHGTEKSQARSPLAIEQKPVLVDIDSRRSIVLEYALA